MTNTKKNKEKSCGLYIGLLVFIFGLLILVVANNQPHYYDPATGIPSSAFAQGHIEQDDFNMCIDTCLDLSEIDLYDDIAYCERDIFNECVEDEVNYLQNILYENLTRSDISDIEYNCYQKEWKFEECSDRFNKQYEDMCFDECRSLNLEPQELCDKFCASAAESMGKNYEIKYLIDDSRILSCECAFI